MYIIWDNTAEGLKMRAIDSLGREMYRTCEDDGCEWEWANMYEPDGTEDYSDLTSIDTDYIFETSPSADDGVDDGVDDDLDLVKDTKIHGRAKARAYRSTSPRHDYDDLYIKRQMKKQTAEINKLNDIHKLRREWTWKERLKV